MPFDRNGLEVLSREECLRLLAAGSLGRVAVSIDALPVILPVNYAMSGNDVVIRTSRGTKLAAAVANAVVAFEVDSVDAERRTGWSVLVTGVSSEIRDEAELAEVRTLPLEPWAPVEMPRFVRVRTDLISGRRIPSSPAEREAARREALAADQEVGV